MYLSVHESGSDISALSAILWYREVSDIPAPIVMLLHVFGETQGALRTPNLYDRSHRGVHHRAPNS